MIPAYDETYLPDAMANLAGAFDYALNDCGLPVGLFMDFFATSEAAALFGRGTPKYVCGMSGEELVYRLGDLEQGEISRPEQTETGYFSLSIYDQGDNNMYMQAYSRIQSVTPGEFAEGGFERNESQETNLVR